MEDAGRVEPGQERQRDRKDPDAPASFNSAKDDVLRIMYAHQNHIAARLFPALQRPLDLEAMRSGALARDLDTIERLATGDLIDVPQRVAMLQRHVLALFFWPPLANDFVVPASFWSTPIGTMFGEAMYRSYRPIELISVTDAAKMRTVSRLTVYRWIWDGLLSYIFDPNRQMTVVALPELDKVRDLTSRSSTTQDNVEDRKVVG